MIKHLFLLSLLLSVPVAGQRQLGVRPTSSGGVLMPEQAAFDVTYYGLTLAIDPAERSIAGWAWVRARIVHPTDWLVLDLDPALEVERVAPGETARLVPDLSFERRQDQVWISLGHTHQPGEQVAVVVFYGGRPRVAHRPPWVGGFVWEKTADGRPWIGVACQQDGADLWAPVKDHPSDEPDRFDLHFTVPGDLEVASNGTLAGVDNNPDGTRTFHWTSANPINTYNMTFNAAPFRTLRSTYTSVSGNPFEVIFWVLPQDYERARSALPQFLDHLSFLEQTLGPYPFASEKYGIVQTPYLGMEHQTVISYGNNFQNNRFGFDWLHFHELAHEWWGNLVSASDWKDLWIHEGFASYLEALYAEKLKGEEGLKEYLAGYRHRLRNRLPVAPRQPQTSLEKYFVAPDYTETDGDVNYKGAWILHTLRYLIGKEHFATLLREFAYPDRPPSRTACRCRFASTEELINTVARITGRDLAWFFEVYLRQPDLPSLQTVLRPRGVELKWIVPDGLAFPMPVEVQVGEERFRVEIPAGGATLPVAEGQQFVIDPGQNILKEES